MQSRPSVADAAPLPEADEMPAGISRAFIRSMLAAGIEAQLPDQKLSDTELDALADATVRMRTAQRALRKLSHGPADATRRAELRSSLEAAIGDFAYIVEMSPAEFTRRVQPGYGIDREMKEDADVVIRPIFPTPVHE